MTKDLPLDRVNNKVFVDIPSSIPKIKFPIPKVGICNRPHIINVLDPFTKERVGLFTEIKVFFNLPSDQRGLHMSRIEECMHQMRSKIDLTPKEYITNLCNKLSESQRQTNCFVELKSFYENTVSKNPSQKKSFELLRLHTIIEKKDDKLKLGFGVTVPFINACPCTQRWGIRDFYNSLKEKGLKDNDIKELINMAPLQAHTNGGNATIIIYNNEFDHKQIYDILERSVPIIRELLKGVDEHTLVKEAHKGEQFCEDNLRSIVANVVKELDGKINPKTIIEIIVEVNESVHFHNLYSEVRDSLENIKEKLSYS